MMYQDIWINGRLLKPGYRPCASRYEILKGFCQKRFQGQAFTVCDIGANMAYFSIRLIEDFDASVVAFEFHEYQKRQAILKRQKTTRLMYVNRKVSLTDLEILSYSTKFDLVLGLSVLHHVVGSAEQWIAAMRKLSRVTIVEMALSDSKRTAGKIGYRIPEGGVVIGHGESHLKEGFCRPMVAFVNE